jgi:transposase
LDKNTSGTFAVRTRRDQHSLSYPLRLPDEIQADALRLLDVSREVINLTVRALWGRLDEFATRTNGYAYKQVEEMIPPPLVHGHRQWRGFAEQAGRILRGQAERKQQFALILAVLKAGILPYAGDDGKALGQTYPMSYDLDQKQLTLALRTPDEQGAWGRTWREKTCQMPLPDLLVERVQAGKTLAPSLREIVEADGAGYAVLDFIVEVAVERPVTFEDIQTLLGFDWGVRMLVRASVVDLDGHQVGHPFFLDTGPFDGRQARLRRQIDQLKAKVARLETQRDRFPVGDKRRKPSEEALPILRREISRCWRKYEARNNDLAHLAANILLVLATAFDCKLLAGESLKSMKSAGRGRGTRGRWRNWRNNSQVRGELWRVLRYKCHLAGMRLEWQQPRHTSHVCPRCGSPANTYSSPQHRDKITAWGAWLCCSNQECLWNGSRDYAASVNIARLGAALIRHAQRTSRVKHPVITDPSVQPVSYIGTRAALRLPPLSPRGHLTHSGRIYCNGWRLSVKLRSSYATPIMLRLCG